MNRSPFAALAGTCMFSLLMAAGAAHAQNVPAAPAAAASDDVRLHAADQTFIADGTKAVATQRDAVRIATSRSTDRDVNALAERVSTDNAKISDALRAASPRGVDVQKNDPGTAVIASINNLRGADFDKAYIEQVALAGEKLKDAAKKTLPTIQHTTRWRRNSPSVSICRFSKRWSCVARHVAA
ncbi:MAG: hypothetical protein CPDRYMAC_3311 [uncultured Paraburkholderia sp.]|nr:MAG: hypothetical protein CPDRYDRY_2904 [uncultured Paraburkholderia sp.]CAH2930190.1 MAG: hypothetical protein CPDRYMAC_3311 [uncultured Paraburkholderia sp.]